MGLKHETLPRNGRVEGEEEVTKLKKKTYLLFVMFKGRI